MANEKSLSPAKVFDRSLDRIERYLKKAKRPRAFKDAGFSQAVRAELFKLEGWSKLHAYWPIKKEAKVFAQIHEQSKRFEDQLGVLDLDRSLTADLRAKDQAEICALFSEDEEKSRKDLKHLLKHESWFVADDGETRIQKMRRHLHDIDWPKTTAQVDFVRSAIAREIAVIGERYRSDWKPELVKAPYNEKTLTSSLHEWRRQLRWVAIYFQTADGLFALAPLGEILTVDKKKLVAEYGRNPLAQLPEKKSTEVLIDPISYLLLTKLIDRTGELKTRAESYFAVRDRLVKNGENLENACDRARSLYGDVPSDLPASTEKLMAEYEKFKPLAYLAESL